MANILYIGNDHPSTTSAHRAHSLERLGHAVTIENPYKAVSKEIRSVLNFLHYRTGYRMLQTRIEHWINAILTSPQKYDAVWVDSGELLGPKAVRLLKSLACPLILYNIDDPTGKRDKGRFSSLLRALPLYDQIVVVRKETEAECFKLGARSVMRVLRSYDEVAHKPYLNSDEIPLEYLSDVAFIGTWMRHEKRDQFLLALLQKGVPVSIWGDRWQKSPYWHTLKSAYKGGALGGRNYVAAIQGAKVCLGFLSKGNRDLHTTRSLEIPYAGGLLCAERTSEHQEMYQDGIEAVFWSSPEECAELCKELLSNDKLREKIKLAGIRRVMELSVGNEDVCRSILKSINITNGEFSLSY